MAVQKSKVSRSKKGKRRSHHSLKKASLSTDKVTGERHLRHNMTSDGFYKGKIESGKFYINKLLPETGFLMSSIMSGAKSYNDYDDSYFDSAFRL